MTARLVLPGTASEADWLTARRQGITASEIAIVMGLSPYSSPFALYHRKTGDLPEQPDSTAMPASIPAAQTFIRGARVRSRAGEIRGRRGAARRDRW